MQKLSVLRRELSKLEQSINNRKCRATPSEFGIALFDSISYVNQKLWDEIVDSRNIFLSTAYLQALEASSIEGIGFRYAMLYQGRQAVAVLAFQTIDLNPGNFGNPKVSLKELDAVKLRLLVCGSVTLSGPNCCAYRTSINPADIYHGVADACYRIRRAEKLHGRIDGVLVKDFYPSEMTPARELSKYGYYKFDVDPNMIISLNRGWNSMEDYLAALSKKYRSRAKRVFKKGSALQIEELSLSKLESLGGELSSLYNAVNKQAKFRIISLNSNYFINLKRYLPDNVRVNGFYLDDLLVGFGIGVNSGSGLEAHTVGMDYQHNREYEIYQNILYNFVSKGIELSAPMITMGRTALEMKSCIGAQPRPMSCFIRHRNPLSNRAISPVFKFLKPSAWVPRNAWRSDAS